MDTDLIDRIYECSVVPDLWPGVLDALAALVDAQGGLLFSARAKGLNWTSSDALHAVFSDYVADGWFRQCPRRVCLFGSTQPAFLVEHDFWTEAQLAETPIYRDFFRPRGLGWSAGTGLPMATGDNIVFSVERRFDAGPLEKDAVARLNDLRPHLARSAFISARLGLQRAAGANETLTALGLPTALLDSAGLVVSANAQMDGLKTHLIWRAGDRIALSDPQAQDHLNAALNGGTASAILSFPVRDAGGQAVLVAHIVPVSRTAHDLFSRSYVLLTLTPVRSENAPAADLIRALFDLTASETRVARALATGQSLEDIARDGGVALTTVRTQLRQVMEKTGCARQAEVVALLANIALPRHV